MLSTFGQDEFGRDMLLRMLWGARYSLHRWYRDYSGTVQGGMLGAFSGYYGGKTDTIIMRVMDILLAIPSMLLATAIGLHLAQAFGML